MVSFILITYADIFRTSTCEFGEGYNAAHNNGVVIISLPGFVSRNLLRCYIENIKEIRKVQ